VFVVGDRKLMLMRLLLNRGVYSSYLSFCLIITYGPVMTLIVRRTVLLAEVFIQFHLVLYVSCLLCAILSFELPSPKMMKAFFL
jgi:hypothetical protein